MLLDNQLILLRNLMLLNNGFILFLSYTLLLFQKYALSLSLLLSVSSQDIIKNSLSNPLQRQTLTSVYIYLGVSYEYYTP